MTGPLTRALALEIVDAVLAAFRAQDLPAILEGFTEDAEVSFGAMQPLHGRAEIATFLEARFRRQRNYRLDKQLRLVEETPWPWRGRAGGTTP